MNIASVLALELGERLAANYGAIFGHVRPEFADLLRSMARIGIERIASSDALYHDADHTILVTMVGQAILQGRILVEHVTPEDWLHFTTATLVHDIGYLRGICAGDGDGRYVINEAGDTLALPRGASDAALGPYHIERGKIFVRHRLKEIPAIDAERIARGIELTRFPVPAGDDHKDTGGEPGLVRAADLIGQLGDPFYLSKLNALFYEFTEIGVAQKRGYESPADSPKPIRASSGPRSSPTSRTRLAISTGPRRARRGSLSSIATSSSRNTPASATARNGRTTPAWEGAFRVGLLKCGAGIIRHVRPTRDAPLDPPEERPRHDAVGSPFGRTLADPVERGAPSGQVRPRRPERRSDRSGAVRAGGLDQIPAIAVEVGEHGDGAVRLQPRPVDEDDAPVLERGMVALEVIRVEKEKHPAAGLRSDRPSLAFVGRSRKQQAAPTRTLRRHDDPAFPRVDRRVLHERETQLPREVRDGFVVIADDQSHQAETLSQCGSPWPAAGENQLDGRTPAVQRRVPGGQSFAASPKGRTPRYTRRQPDLNQFSLTNDFDGPCDRGNPCAASRPRAGEPIEAGAHEAEALTRLHARTVREA